MKSRIITIGLMGALAVALGALGAHFLKNKLNEGLMTADQLSGFETAVRYHIYHVLAMLALLVWNSQQKSKWLDWAHACFFWGTVLFSGSLYILCTRSLLGLGEGIRALGPVTPIGGVVLIAGWLLLVVHGLKTASKSQS